jgi:hypothetical protein
LKPVRIVLSPESEEAYKLLNEFADSKIEKSILNSIVKKKELIKANPHYGEPIAKDRIPQEYKIK